MVLWCDLLHLSVTRLTWLQMCIPRMLLTLLLSPRSVLRLSLGIGFVNRRWASLGTLSTTENSTARVRECHLVVLLVVVLSRATQVVLVITLLIPVPVRLITLRQLPPTCTLYVTFRM